VNYKTYFKWEAHISLKLIKTRPRPLRTSETTPYQKPNDKLAVNQTKPVKIKWTIQIEWAILGSEASPFRIQYTSK